MISLVEIGFKDNHVGFKDNHAGKKRYNYWRNTASQNVRAHRTSIQVSTCEPLYSCEKHQLTCRFGRWSIFVWPRVKESYQLNYAIMFLFIKNSHTYPQTL